MATALALGDWDPRFSMVLAVTTVGDVGAALVDANGDGADLNLDLYRRSLDGSWRETSSSGGAGDWGRALTSDLVALHDRTTPGARVRVEYAGVEHEVNASATGWWLFVAPACAEHPGAKPGVVTSRP